MTTSKDYKAIITEIYRRYNPDKIQEIPSLLEKYAAHEEELLEHIFAKYEFTDIEKQRLYQQGEESTEVIINRSETKPSAAVEKSKSSIAIYLLLIVLMVSGFYFALKEPNDEQEIRKLTTAFMEYAKTANGIADYVIVTRHYSEVADNASEATITMRTKEVEVEKRQVGYVHLRFRKYDDGWGIVETAFTTSADHNREYYTFPAPLTLKTIKMITQNE